MMLDFEPERYSRSMTKEEWLRSYRWVRQTRKKLRSNEEKTIAALYLVTDKRIRREIIDNVIYPPILMIPDLPENQNFQMTSGSIAYVTTQPRKRFLP